MVDSLDVDGSFFLTVRSSGKAGGMYILARPCTALNKSVDVHIPKQVERAVD
jgi:hypothetical protein